MNDPIAPMLATPSSRLVEFLRSRTADNLPPGVLQKARICLLDSLGCGLYGALTPWGKIAAEVVYEEHSRLPGRRVPPSSMLLLRTVLKSTTLPPGACIQERCRYPPRSP